MSKRLSSIAAYLFAAWFLLAPFSALAKLTEREVQKLIREQGAVAKKNANLYYDEVFDASGELRPQYRDIYPKMLQRSAEEIEKIRKLTKRDFEKDNAVSAFALITDEKEHDLKRKGVAQRGRALHEFLRDHYSGKKTYASVIPPHIVDAIIERTGESGYAGHIDPDRIRFMYGPDMIRGYDGKFYVLEDNTNYLGGQGDLVEARRSLWEHAPEYPELLSEEKLADTKAFYRNLVARYRAEMPNPKDKIIFFAVPPYPDNEDYRLIKIWKELGVELVTPFTRDPKLVKRADGMYLMRKTAKSIRYKKVGFIIGNAEFSGLDPTFKPSYNQFLQETARNEIAEKSKFKKYQTKVAALQRALEPHAITGQPNFDEVERILRYEFRLGYFTEGTVPGLVEAIVKGQVLANNTPGIDFINDKEFNMYVDDLIRHYLGEEPILQNLPARRLYKADAKGHRVVDEEVFRDLIDHQEKYVVKVVDGRGGEGVYVGAKEPREKWLAMVEMRRKNTDREAIAQAYRHPSVVAGDIVDERILAQVGPAVKGVHVEVSPVGWSRGVTMNGDGKVNLSQGKAHELVVIERDVGHLSTTKSPKNCPALYRATVSPR